MFFRITFPLKTYGHLKWRAVTLSLSQYNARGEYSFVYPRDSRIKHSSGHCLPDPPLPSLWSREKSINWKPESSPIWMQPDGTKVGMSILAAEIPSLQLSATPGGDTISGHEARRSLLTDYCTQITNPLCQHSAVMYDTDVMQLCTPLDYTDVHST